MRAAPLLTQHGESAGDTLWLVERRGILLAAVVLAVAAWLEAQPVAVMAGLILALAIVARGWSRLALTGLYCGLTFDEDRAFPDDEVRLTLSIENRGLLPIPWLEVDLVLPFGLYPIEAVPEKAWASERTVHLLLTMLPFRSERRTYRLRCRQRGLFAVPEVALLVADPLRLFPRRVLYRVDTRLIVYPRVVALEALGLGARLPQGDVTLRTMLQPDPLRPIGVRDYRPGDSPRSIHWKASARRAQLQVKVLERTAQLQIALYLDAGGFDRPSVVYREALFERAITAAASIAAYVIERGGRIALGTSGDDATYVPPGGGLDHLQLLLETLAVVAAKRGRPLESVLAGSASRQAGGTTIVAIVPEVRPE
ncbi:MAG: DUF58 domain-containing protein, partial [Chloroflexota bacterium]|nr:DUF58 domain-containing protein [Chloroflexota bacterium]